MVGSLCILNTSYIFIKLVFQLSGLYKHPTYLQLRGVSIHFSYVSMRMYVVGVHWKVLNEALLMGTHNICFQKGKKISKLFC